MTHPVDNLFGMELIFAAAAAEGVDPASFSPWGLFVREVRIVERLDKIFRVYVMSPKLIPPGYIGSFGACPVEACMRAFIKSRQ